MGLPFRSSARGTEVRLPADERSMLADLLGQLDELLDDGTGGSDDPFDELVRMSGLADLEVGDPKPESAGAQDAGAQDAGAQDAGPQDAGRDDTGPQDAGPREAAAEPNGARTPPPDDPALARLLPDANRDDPELAAEFRRLTESGLRARKRAGARLAADALRREQPVMLTAEETQALLKALTDLRLVLGERLGLKTDEDATKLELQLTLGVEPYEGWLPLAATYETLRWLQEALVQSLSTRK
jgi:hypothetical protein